jgi:hypothetical protein
MRNNYKEFLTEAFRRKKGFSPPWREFTLHEPRAYVDYSVSGQHPIELVNTGFTLPTLLLFAYHWSDVIKDYIEPTHRINPPRKNGMHISLTKRLSSDYETGAYLYGLRILDTVIFRPGNRRDSSDYLGSLDPTSRGMFRSLDLRLEIRYPQPSLDKRYLLNQFIISAKYTNDLNRIASFRLGSAFNLMGVESDYLPVANIDRTFAKRMGQQYLDTYAEILNLSPEEKAIFKEHFLTCMSR